MHWVKSELRKGPRVPACPPSLVLVLDFWFGFGRYDLRGVPWNGICRGISRGSLQVYPLFSRLALALRLRTGGLIGPCQHVRLRARCVGARGFGSWRCRGDVRTVRGRGPSLAHTYPGRWLAGLRRCLPWDVRDGEKDSLPFGVWSCLIAVFSIDPEGSRTGRISRLLRIPHH